MVGSGRRHPPAVSGRAVEPVHGAGPHGQVQRGRTGAPGSANRRPAAPRAPGREPRSRSVETPRTLQELIRRRKSQTTPQPAAGIRPVIPAALKEDR